MTKDELKKVFLEKETERKTKEKKERWRLAQKKYREAHGAKVRARQKAWHEKNPEYNAKKMQEFCAKYPLRYLVNNAKQRTKGTDTPFNIAPADLFIPDFCPVLGIPLFRGTKPFEPNSPSLDRVIDCLGYVKGNVQVISNRANMIKRDGTAKEHELIAAYIRRHGGE